MVTVRCYTTCDEVALTLNDRPLGTKLRSTARDGVLVWEVPFEPGVLKAVGLKNGSPSSEFILRTAGAPARIELVPDKMRLSQRDRQIAHVEFRVTDAEGVIVPDATHPVEFGVEGPATLLGLENGDLASADTGKTHTRRVFRGRGLAILRVGDARVKIQLTANCPGLQGAKLELQAVNGL